MRVAGATFFALLALSACGEAPSGSEQGGVPPEFDASRALFEELRDQSGNNYDYVTRRWAQSEQGMWNCHFETTISVRDGQVVERVVVVTPRDTADICDESFGEQGPSVGQTPTHVAAAPPVPIEQWYQRCEDEVIPSENPFPEIGALTPYQISEEGLLQRCGWVEADFTHLAYGSPFIYIDSVNFF